MLRANLPKQSYDTDEQTPSVCLARSVSELSSAFHLVHDSYVQAGLDSHRDSRLRVTPHQMLPSTDVFIATLDQEVISTVSLMGDGVLGLPMQSMYPAEIEAARREGLVMAEVGALADRRQSLRRSMATFYAMTRMLAQCARLRGIDTLVAAVHPRHSRFYERVLGFEVFGDRTHCPYAQDNPAVALRLTFEHKRGTPVFDHYFGEPIGAEALQPVQRDEDLQAFFENVAIIRPTTLPPALATPPIASPALPPLSVISAVADLGMPTASGG
jgi:hypothetical protein